MSKRQPRKVLPWFEPRPKVVEAFDEWPIPIFVTIDCIPGIQTMAHAAKARNLLHNVVAMEGLVTRHGLE